MVLGFNKERNMKMKCLFAMMAAALTLAAVAQDPAPDKAHQVPAGALDPIVRAALNPKVSKKIGLTEEQQAKLRAVAGDKDVLKTLQEKVRKGMSRQAELVAAEKIDEPAVMKALDEVFEARREVAKYQMRRLIAVKSILTPEQIKMATEAFRSLKRSKKAKADE